MSEKVVSREYKVLLKKELFIGSEQELLKSAQNFWQAFSQAINNIIGEVNGDLQQIADQRIIRFYDTDEYLIYKNSYILRERLDANNNEREVTLKFRNRDRYISQDRNMNRGEAKFEEDIKNPFEVLYSFSDTQIISTDNKLNKIQDATQLYPDLLDKVSLLKAEQEIRTIGVTIREIVIKGAKFQIRNEPRLDSKCALIIWYNNNHDPEKPVAVEFSFKYGDQNEVYSRKVAQRAYDVFHILQEILTYWVDLDSDTKTAYIYKLDAKNTFFQ
ncbi:hypothetical protein [Nostoc sp. NMS8]|uniref:hypothetical protein n=1 Tax=Nostoc sp. NMS8 TaxID=2815392 RepID=UPI0025EBDBBE|nr:hypothetical protein [Nostoc sp. NMS8]MBN3958883.1 hypothetical protein [Nostoc sp. NMS8]